MRIILYVPIDSGFVETWPLAHIVDELVARGHTVEHVNPAIGLGRVAGAAEYSEYLLHHYARLRGGQPYDLFFAIAGDVNLEPDAVSEIRRSIPTVLMCTDDQSVPFEYERIAPRFDLVWATSREGSAVLRSFGARTVMMPYAANPRLFAGSEAARPDSAICFVGRSYGIRTRLLTMLAENGITTRLYGKGPEAIYTPEKARTPLTRAVLGGGAVASYVFKSLRFPVGRRCVAGAIKRTVDEVTSDRVGRTVLGPGVERLPAPTFEDMGRVFSRNALSLGSVLLHSTFTLKYPVHCIHLREFEAPMCGAVHLVNRCDEIREYFAEGAEILCYGSPDELLDTARSFLLPARLAEIATIRKAARRRAVADHTWSRRFVTLAAGLGLRWRDEAPAWTA
jgi:hypothetical protein